VLITVPVYNETVTVVEAPTSFFDPQMYVPSRDNQTQQRDTAI
jgi:hypothetical protein